MKYFEMIWFKLHQTSYCWNNVFYHTLNAFKMSWLWPLNIATTFQKTDKVYLILLRFNTLISIWSQHIFETIREDLCDLGLHFKLMQTIIVITYHNNIRKTTYLVCVYRIIHMCLFVVCIFLFVTDFCVCGTYELPTYVRIIYKTNEQTF